WNVLRGVCGAILGTRGQIICRRTRSTAHECAHLIQTGIYHLQWCNDAPATGDPPARSQSGATHDPRSPDVAIDAAFGSKPVIIAGLTEQFVELGLVCCGDFGADFSDMRIVRGRLGFFRNSMVDRPQEHVWQFECSWLSDVEAVYEPIAHQIEIAGDRRACFA